MLRQCKCPSLFLGASDGFRKIVIVVFGSAPSLKAFIQGQSECYNVSWFSKQSLGKLGSKMISNLKHNHQLLGLDLENPQFNPSAFFISCFLRRFPLASLLVKATIK